MVTITFPQFEGQTPQNGDPFAGFPDAPPSQAQQPGVGQGGDPWASFPDEAPKSSTKPQRNVGQAEAALRGGAEGLTFGFAPAVAGLAAASGMPSSAQSEGDVDLNPVRPIVGAAKLLENYFSDHPDPAVQEAYQRGRQATLDQQNLAEEQHPYAFLAGQLGSALATPAFGAAKGASILGRLGASTLAGTITGGLYGTGEATSENKSASDIVKSALGGSVTGAAFGAGGSAALSGAGALGSKLGSLIRGQTDTNTEAARRVVNALSEDFSRHGPSLDRPEIAAANAAGLPRAIVDMGAEKTRGLARSAANTSPDARQALDEMTSSRFEQQSPRIAGFIRRMTGGGNASDDLEAIQSAARAFNRPLYARAYKAGDRPIFSPELERLIGSPAVESAIKGAVERGQNRAVNEGMGAFRSGVTITPDGRVKFNKGPKGVPTYPNLQFWDYVQRELRDMATSAERQGRNEEASALKGLHRQLRAELDQLVPEFAAARQTAASFFGAENALEAGQKFVMSNASLPDARRALARMTLAERALFARGFASELADRIERTGDNRNVLNSIFLNNGPAKQKIIMALGAKRAAQLEALLRAESIVDKARKALGNSTTARQIAEMGMAGGAVATFEGLKEHDFNPAHVIAAALTFGAVRHGAKIVDEKVARRVGELLASDNPALLAKGVQLAASRPVIMDALRRATGAVARVSAHKIGPARAAAGAGAVLQRAIAGPGNEASAGNDFADQFSQ